MKFFKWVFVVFLKGLWSFSIKVSSNPVNATFISNWEQRDGRIRIKPILNFCLIYYDRRYAEEYELYNLQGPIDVYLIDGLPLTPELTRTFSTIAIITERNANRPRFP